MIESILKPTVEWAAAHGPPNALFVAALLTRPSTWTNRAVALANRYTSDETSSDDAST